MTVSIRSIRREDAETIVGMTHEFGAYLNALGDTWEPKFTLERCLEDGFGDNPAFEGFIAEEGGQPLGYILFTPTYDTDLACRVLFVIDLWVRPWTRRLGVGRKLMGAAAETARQRGFGCLLWCVFKPNKLARRFYDSLGAQEIDDLDWMRLTL